MSLEKKIEKTISEYNETPFLIKKTKEQLKEYRRKIATYKDRAELRELYSTVFKGVPFCENTPLETIDEIITEDIEKGTIVTSIVENKIKAFLVLKEGIEKENILIDKRYYKNKTLFYVADLGVSPDMWGNGIGTDLFKVGDKVYENDDTYIAAYMRTNASIAILEETKMKLLSIINDSSNKPFILEKNKTYMELSRIYGRNVKDNGQYVNENNEIVLPSMSAGIAEKFGYCLARKNCGMPILLRKDNPDRDSSLLSLKYLKRSLAEDIRCYYVKEKEKQLCLK